MCDNFLSNSRNTPRQSIHVVKGKTRFEREIASKIAYVTFLVKRGNENKLKRVWKWFERLSKSKENYVSALFPLYFRKVTYVNGAAGRPSPHLFIERLRLFFHALVHFHESPGETGFEQPVGVRILHQFGSVQERLGHRLERVQRPRVVPVDGGAVDQGGVQAAAATERRARRRGGQNDVEFGFGALEEELEDRLLRVADAVLHRFLF